MIDALNESLRRIVDESRDTRVSTTTVLPSGALASVAVRPAGNGTFFVSDEGAGLRDLAELGHFDLTGGDTRRGNKIAERLGLIFEDGGFSLRSVTADQLAGAIVFVAEASRQWASRTAEKAIQRAEAVMTAKVEERILTYLPDARIDRDREIAGHSTKRHRFDLVLHLKRNRKAVFEILAPNTNALSSTHMKLFDLKEEHEDWPREVVTERIEDWSNADMNLLSAVATKVRDLRQDWRDLAATLQ